MIHRLVPLLLVAFSLVVAAPDATGQRIARRAVAERPPEVELGPEMQAYLRFIDTEQEELQHLYDEGEVPPDDYKRSRDKLVATKAAALRIIAERGGDSVPELYVLRASELTQVLPAGIEAIRGKRAGTRIDEDWIYHGTLRRGDLFHILERTSGIGRDTSY